MCHENSHGVDCSEVVLPWENKQEFNELHQTLRQEYYPDGVSEEAAVFKLASLYWKRRRRSIGNQLALARSYIETTVSHEVSQSVRDESKQNDPAALELTSLFNEIEGIGKEAVLPPLRLTETYDFDQKPAERAYSPDLMEKELKLLAHFDRQIAKAMESLVSAKHTGKIAARISTIISPVRLLRGIKKFWMWALFAQSRR